VGRGGQQPRQRRSGPALPAGSCPEARQDGVREKPGWPSLGAATATLLAMQTKLHQWSRADANRRFDDLHNLVHEPAFLVVAWDQVAHNTGARTAGLDGRSPRSIAEPEEFLAELRARLKARQFVPHGCGSTPSFAAIDLVAAHSDGYSVRCSSTMRSARSRISDGYKTQGSPESPVFPGPLTCSRSSRSGSR
jgi:hypothetical protein